MTWVKGSCRPRSPKLVWPVFIFLVPHTHHGVLFCFSFSQISCLRFTHVILFLQPSLIVFPQLNIVDSSLPQCSMLNDHSCCSVCSFWWPWTIKTKKTNYFNSQSYFRVGSVVSNPKNSDTKIRRILRSAETRKLSSLMSPYRPPLRAWISTSYTLSGVRP